MLLNKIVEKIFAEGRNKKMSKKKDITTLISGAKMHIEAVMAETELNVFDILNLKEEDVIVFNKNATSPTAKLYINNKEKFLSVCGVSNSRKAVQIKSNIDHEKQETLEILRSMRQERVEYQKQQNETVKKLLEERNKY